jgi:putative glycosyltransferase (TIGR04372 family)
VSQFILRVHRLSAFARTQTVKTIARPSRLLTLPLLILLRHLCVPILLCVPRLAPVVVSWLPQRWLSSGLGKAFCDKLGHDLFQHDRPEEAWQCFDLAIGAGQATIDEYLFGSMCLYHGLGRFKDAMALFARANAQNSMEAQRRGLSSLPFRVLDSVWARHIGHIATIDYVIKLGILEGRKPEDTIWYLPQGSRIANRFLLQQVAAHLRLIDDPRDLPFDPDAVQALHYDYLGPRLPDGKTAYFSQVANQTYRRWRQEGREPIFKLPPEIVERGWQVLDRAGVPRNSWFVALHVREGKWDGRNGGLHGGVLNADIDTYLPAITAITQRGGWVIRMGDPGMKPLRACGNVIDYCHSDFRSDWMDVFLAASCRFMAGTSSGPAFIPPIYGVPAVLTNWWPPAERAWHWSDIFVPKLLRRRETGQYLTLTETLTEPFSWCHSTRYLSEREGVVVEDNDPEMIRAAVEEMLDRSNGVESDRETASLRQRVDAIYESHGVFGQAHLAREFLRRHPGLIA